MLGKWIMGGFWGWVRSYSRCSLCFVKCQKSFAIILCTHIVRKMLKAQSLKGVDILRNPSPPSPTYELYCIRVWKHLCWGCVVIHLSICEPGFFFFFNFLFCEIKILGEKNFKTLAKLVKSALEKHISPPNSPTFFFRRCRVLRIFHWELFFQVRSHLFCLHFLWHVPYVFAAFLVTCTLSISLSRTFPHFNSLFGQVSQVSTLFDEKSHTFQFSLLTSHTFQCEYWIACNEFLLIRSTSNLSNKELGSQMHNMFCTKFQKHKHHKLQRQPIIERSNELC